MSHSALCLNCDEKTIGKFCYNCGQKTDTHRITFKHFIFHDILHGVWHFEKGIFFTLKQALIRPGKAALEYISGKRIRYYNVFYLVLLFIGLNLFLCHWYDVLANANSKVVFESKSNITGKVAEEFLSKYAKIILFLFVPFFALNSYLLFKKVKLNYSEHSIIAGVVVLGFLFFTAISNALFFLELTKNFSFISDIANVCTPIIIILYVIFGYYQAFRFNYKLRNFIFRMLFFLLFCGIEMFLFLIFLFGYASDWKFGSMAIG